MFCFISLDQGWRTNGTRATSGTFGNFPGTQKKFQNFESITKRIILVSKNAKLMKEQTSKGSSSRAYPTS